MTVGVVVVKYTVVHCGFVVMCNPTLRLGTVLSQFGSKFSTSLG